MPGNGQPNVGGNLIRIHRVITRGMQVAAERSGHFAQQGFPDDKTRDGFTKYVRCLVTVLAGHHSGEDDLAFPCFRPKLPDAPFDVLEAEHKSMLPVLRDIGAALELIESSARPQALLNLQASLHTLDAIWQPHIAKEENHFSAKVLARVMPPDEHARLGMEMALHGQQRSKPEPLVLPFILFNLDGAERSVMLQLLPPEVANHLIPNVWREHWEPMRPFLLG